jgi:hypothetical protein
MQLHRMNSSDALTTASYVFIVLCFTAGWLNLAGAGLAIAVLIEKQDDPKDAAFLSLIAQFAPLLAALLLFLTTILAFALNRTPPSWALMAFILPAFLVGPVMSLRLLGKLARASGARKRVAVRR